MNLEIKKLQSNSLNDVKTVVNDYHLSKFNIFPPAGNSTTNKEISIKNTIQILQNRYRIIE